MMHRIVATGGHSGLGYEALRHLVRSAPSSLRPPYHIVLLVRDPTALHVQRAAANLQSLLACHDVRDSTERSIVELQTMDLARLDDVRRVGAQLREDLQRSQQHVDVLMLNAGVAKAQRDLVPSHSLESDHLTDSQGRYEHTAAVNHIAHLLLVEQLLPMLSRDRTPRIVFTGSALHRRAELSHLDCYFSGHSQSTGPWDLRGSYAASKLLQLTGVQRMVSRLEERFKTSDSAEAEKGLEVVVVQPGFVPSTALIRESTLPARLFMWLLSHGPFSFVASIEEAGRTISAAVSEPLTSFPSAEGSLAPRGSWDPRKAEGLERHVKTALVVRGQKLEQPDPRTFDEDLQQSWWPAGVHFR